MSELQAQYCMIAKMTICSKNLWGTWPPKPPLTTPMPADKVADMSELQAQHCMIPEQ